MIFISSSTRRCTSFNFHTGNRSTSHLVPGFYRIFIQLRGRLSLVRAGRPSVLHRLAQVRYTEVVSWTIPCFVSPIWTTKHSRASDNFGKGNWKNLVKRDDIAWCSVWPATNRRTCDLQSVSAFSISSADMSREPFGKEINEPTEEGSSFQSSVRNKTTTTAIGKVREHFVKSTKCWQSCGSHFRNFKFSFRELC